MRCLLFNKTGLEDLLKEEMHKQMKQLPLNERFEKVHNLEKLPRDRESHPPKVDVISVYRSYAFNFDDDLSDRSEIVDLVGPYYSVPNFIVVSSDYERQKVLGKGRRAGYMMIWQRQLIILEKSVSLRTLLYDKDDLTIYNDEGIYLMDGNLYYDNRERRPLRDNEIGCGDAITENSNEEYHTVIAKPRIWEMIVKEMISYFLTEDFRESYNSSNHSHKIIFGSERCKNETVKILEEIRGLKEVNHNF